MEQSDSHLTTFHRYTGGDILVRVTDPDIDAGVRGSDKNCPVALALRRDHPDLMISVSLCGIIVGNCSFNTPNKVARFISDFDSGEQVHAMEFTLEHRRT